MRPALILASIVLAAVLGSAPGFADSRVALVIGNGGYQNVPALLNPPNDAREVAAALERLGFTVRRVIDGNFNDTRRALRDFAAESQQAELSVVFYSGHGIELGGENWLVPVDAELKRDVAVDYEAISLRSIMTMVGAASRLGLVILDACRTNPFAAQMQRSVSTKAVEKGLARVEPTGSVLVAYAAKDGTTALDGVGNHSPFTAALLRNIETPGLDIGFIFRRVHDEVLVATNRVQEPYTYGALPQKEIFLKAPANPDPGPGAFIEQDWRLVESTTSIAALEAFKRRHPGSFQADLADLRIEELKRAASAPPVAPMVSSPAKPEQLPGMSRFDLVAQDWRLVETSTNIAALEAFKRRHPGTFQADLADLRIADLKLAATAPPAAPVNSPPPPPVVSAMVPPPATPPTDSPAPMPVVSAAAPAAAPPIDSPPPVPVLSAPAPPLVAPVDPPPPSPIISAMVAPPIIPPAPVDPCGGVVTVSFAARCAAPLTAAQERGLEPKDSFRECDKCPEMVVVPAGSFAMGSPTREAERIGNEGPQHPVKIGKAFAVGRFSVTFDDWDACVADGGCNGYMPSDSGWGHGRRPAVNVSWEDAKAYVTWLSHKTGKTYRLLSEAEREFVTRAGTTTPFWWGESITASEANYDGTRTYHGSPKGDYRKQTVVVDSFEPNAFGLYQVHGNIWEWVEDCYHATYAGAPTDGSAWLTGDCKLRVMRGGSWYGYPKNLRSAVRNFNSTDGRLNGFGFRVARTL